MTKILAFLSFLFFIINLSAQKKVLDTSVYDIWNQLSKSQISNNGKYVSYEINPYKGDGNLYLYNKSKDKTVRFERAYGAVFSPESNFMVFKIRPQADSLRELKLKKTKKSKLPTDSLGIYVFGNGKTYKIPKIKSFKTAEENASWVAYTYSKTETDSVKKAEKKKAKTYDKSAPKTYDFEIFNPVRNKKYSFENVSEFSMSRNGRLIVFVKLQNDSLLRSTSYIFDTRKRKLDSLPAMSGLTAKLACDNLGKQFAFLHSNDTVKRKVYGLYLRTNTGEAATLIADSLSSELPENWAPSPNAKIYFSRDDSKLFFGTALKPKFEKKDTLLESEKIKVDIWHWNDPDIQPYQLVNLEKEKKRTYLAVYHIKKRKLVRLANEKLKNPKTINKGNGNLLLATDDSPYAKQKTWDYAGYRDVYLTDVNTGKSEKILTKHVGDIALSPGGTFLLYFNKYTGIWSSYNVKTKQHKQLTNRIETPFADEEHDYPSLPSSYGFAGWVQTPDAPSAWIYDRYDIWQIDLNDSVPPQNITKIGRKTKTKFRYLKLDEEQEYINEKTKLFSAFDCITKNDGFYKKEADAAPEKILTAKYQFYQLKKAKNTNDIIFRRENTQQYGNLYVSNLNFEHAKRISDANPQQKNYNWVTCELFKWTPPNKKEEEGLLFKPENFDPTKKYPVVVYFYRLYSDELNRHWAVYPSRSTINPTFYASNGYLVFIPNIRFEIGHPGNSAYNYIMSGTQALCKLPYVDKDHIGIQGQSWGGYQSAFVVTKTDFFKAAMAGAPVSDMFSAYGGIRWKSGLSRAFQYEKTQSRIGATPWEKPELYVENSPIFHVPNINTPLLIMHNDKDGAVPWSQSIELYIAMRRLNKPVWLLNYNGEPHNLKSSSPDRKDLSIRMMQFFDHYLKEKPAPVWLEKGIPAIEKGENLGYDIENP